MFGRFVLFVLWTALMVWCLSIVWGSMYAPEIHTEVDPKVSVGTARYLVVGSDTTVSVASCGNFLLWRKNTTDTIAGTSAPVPLGTDCSSYYTYGPMPMKPGTWLIQSGNPELQFQTGGQPFKVDVIWDQATAILSQFVFTLLIAAVWILVSAAIFGVGT